MSKNDCTVSPQQNYLEFNITNGNTIYLCPRTAKSQIKSNTHPPSVKVDEKQYVLNSKLCDQWNKNPLVNPLTNKPIKQDGPTYRKIEEICKIIPKCEEWRKDPTRNPITKRKVNVTAKNGIYQKLLKLCGPVESTTTV